RDIDPPDRRVLCEPVGRSGGRQPVGVRLERREESVHPAACAPALVPGRRPRPELLAVVAHRADPAAVVAGMLAQVADDLIDLAEGDPVAEALFGAEDPESLAVVVGRVRAP